MSIRTMAAICMVGCRAGTPLARADGETAEQKAAARRAYDLGTKAYNLGDFPTAIAHYKDAYNNVAEPAFLYNIAQAYRLANDLPQALFFYKSYVRNLPDAGNRAEVDARI